MFVQPATTTSNHTLPGGEAVVTLEHEVERLTDALAARFEELTLIHDLSQSLTLTEESTGVIASLLDELLPCIEAETLVITISPDDGPESSAIMRHAGKPVECDWVHQIADQVSLEAARVTGETPLAAVSNSFDPGDGNPIHVAVVRIARSSQVLGRMIAIRSIQQEEFGTIEADLMKSTSMMLGVHLINQRQYLELQSMFEGMIQSLVSALDAKDTYTHGHSNRVADLSVHLASRLGYDEASIARIRMGAILHDIGKIGVDDSVLRKPGKLTAEEFKQIQEHPMIGYDILKGIRKFGPILPIVRNHHESWDGSGYPDGLVGDQIPRDAQIVAVADSFDAMTSDRPYRRGMDIDRVVKIFQQCKGTQWAVDVVDALLDPEVLQKFVGR